MSEQKTILLEVKARQVTNKEDGTKFMAFETYTKNNTRITLKFRREVEDLPKTEGTYYIEVLAIDANISNKKKYPELWVKKIKRFIETEEIESKQADKVASLFDTTEDEENNKKLPF